MQDKLKVNIITPEKVYKSIEVDGLKVFTDHGQVTIMPHHTAFIANIEISIVTTIIDGVSKHYAVGGGVIRVKEKDETAYLILNSFISVEDIDQAKVELEKKEAEEEIKNAKSNIEHRNAELHLKRILNETSAKNKYDI